MNVYFLLFVPPTWNRGNPFVTLDLIARTADSVCDGDLIERRIRAQSKWELLPLQVHRLDVTQEQRLSKSV